MNVYCTDGVLGMPDAKIGEASEAGDIVISTIGGSRWVSEMPVDDLMSKYGGTVVQYYDISPEQPEVPNPDPDDPAPVPGPLPGPGGDYVYLSRFMELRGKFDTGIGMTMGPDTTRVDIRFYKVGQLKKSIPIPVTPLSYWNKSVKGDLKIEDVDVCMLVANGPIAAISIAYPTGLTDVSYFEAKFERIA